ncbi:hypothetical protein Vafri_4431 [Volvox africanus]|uniref:MYND-type domain-containing protein n=1 Tax=Volvox africanus TaxID=51714 RepID=A0A8J4ATZ6_9CHLO|nr:hypothetical protein Vafri_4431 [Volvox africanus]
METFFPEGSCLRYWLCNASVSHIACSVSWPPIIAAIGYAPCVRAWAPTSKDEPEFKPVLQLLEVDGERFVAVTVKGDLLVAADASSSGRISIWDTTTWTRQQTLTAEAPVTSLDASRTYIAAGTAAGYVRVWKRQSAGDATFTQFFAPDLQLDSLPVYTVKLGPLRHGGSGAGSGGGSGGGGTGGSGGGSGSDGGGGGDAVMVVHTRGNSRVSAWRLSDAKIIGTLSRSGPPDSAEALLSANVVHSCLAKDVLLTCSWLPGSDPLLQWIHPVQRAGGEVPGISQHLAGLARPLCCEYDGSVIVMGCEDGTVWVWGLLLQGQTSGPPHQQQPQQQQEGEEVSHWRGYHGGAVGAVACLPHRGQIASAGADSCVKLWSMTGTLLAVTRLGWQPTALGINELALVVGGAAGQIQILLLLTEEHAAGSRPTEADQLESRTPPLATATATATAASQGSVMPYAYWFDARSPKESAAASSNGDGSGGVTTGKWGLAAAYPDAFSAFMPPRRPVALTDLQKGPVGQLGGSSNSSSTGGATGSQGGLSSATGAADAAGGGGGGAGGGKASSFNMQAALKGAQRNAAAQAAEEEAKRAQLRAMGEGPGVARTRGAVQLESATAATMGRKCANPSCFQREGLLALQQRHHNHDHDHNQAGSAAAGGFKRCGACKSVVYCSTHCQSTHWRDGHKKECPQLAEAWRRQQEQEQQEQEQQEQEQCLRDEQRQQEQNQQQAGREETNHIPADSASDRPAGVADEAVDVDRDHNGNGGLQSSCNIMGSGSGKISALAGEAGDGGCKPGLVDTGRACSAAPILTAGAAGTVDPAIYTKEMTTAPPMDVPSAVAAVAAAPPPPLLVGTNGFIAGCAAVDCLHELD